MLGCAINNGIPKNIIYRENQSTNTIENFQYTKQLIENKKLDINSIIFVCRPYVEKRIWACFKKYMPEYKGIIASESISCKNYMLNYDIPNVSKDAWINVLVGDIQRMKIYAERGLQEKVTIPDNVWKAYEEDEEQYIDIYVGEERENKYIITKEGSYSTGSFEDTDAIIKYIKEHAREKIDMNERFYTIRVNHYPEETTICLKATDELENIIERDTYKNNWNYYSYDYENYDNYNNYDSNFVEEVY